jgi:hypothetical protein
MYFIYYYYGLINWITFKKNSLIKEFFKIENIKKISKDDQLCLENNNNMSIFKNITCKYNIYTNYFFSLFNYLKYMYILSPYNYFKLHDYGNFYISYKSSVREFKTILKKTDTTQILKILNNIEKDNNNYKYIKLTNNTEIIVNKIEINNFTVKQNSNYEDIKYILKDFIFYKNDIYIKDILLANNISFNKNTTLNISYYYDYEEINVTYDYNKFINLPINKIFD